LENRVYLRANARQRGGPFDPALFIGTLPKSSGLGGRMSASELCVPPKQFSGGDVVGITMKKFLQLPILLGVAALLGACSTINTRINERSAVFNQLDPNTQAKISHGDIDIGFTPDMVYMALGNPDVRREAVTTDGQTETWVYRSYYGDEVSAFGGWHGYHRWYAFNPYGRFYRVYWEPVYYDAFPQVAEDDIRVTFRNGRVIMIDQART
jgi:hypothetical protein